MSVPLTLGESRSFYPRIKFEFLPCVGKKVINLVFLIRNHIANKGWQRILFLRHSSLGSPMVLVFGFAHKHFTMQEASFVLYSISYR